jgi:hypothetical protein
MSDKAEIKEIERLTYDVPEAGAMCGLNRVQSYIAATFRSSWWAVA